MAKPTLKTLRKEEISNLLSYMEEIKKHIIELLLSYAPNSLPTDFHKHLKTVLYQLIVHKKCRYHYSTTDFGFTGYEHLKKEMELLQIAWKGIIQMSSINSKKIFNSYDVEPYCIFYDLCQ